MNNQPPQLHPQQPLAPQQQTAPSSGNSNTHPRSNYQNNGNQNNSTGNTGGRHHYANNNNNNNNNNNKPYRKNFNKDGQYHQMPVQYPPYYSPVVYGFPLQQQQYYYSVPMQSYDQYQTAGFYQTPLNYLPDQLQPHQLTLTDKSGNRIPLKKPTHSRLPSTASPIVAQPFIAVPPLAPVSSDQEAPVPLVPITPVQPAKNLNLESVPVATAPSPLKALSDNEKLARAAEFKAKIAARAALLKKQKEELAAAAGTAAGTAAPAPTTAPAAAPASTPAPAATPAAAPVATPATAAEVVKKAEAPVAPKAEVKPVEVSVKEEPKAEVKPVSVKEEPKKEESKKEEPKVLVPKALEPETVPVKAASPVETPTAVAPVVEAKEVKEEVKEEPKVEETKEETVLEVKEEPPVPSFTISNLFNLLRFARPVNPYTYTYPSTVTAPDARLKNGKKIRYDPGFLIQFQKPLDLPKDDEWDSKYGAKIVISESRQNRPADRSFSRNSSSQFGKGFIGNGAVQMRSQTNLRNNDFNSRSGSRQNSKRKNPKEKSSRNKGSKRGGPQEEEKPSEPAEPVKPLVKSESRWIPRSRASALVEVKTAPDGTVLLSDEDVQRKVQSLLNKLTLELFDVISTDIINIANQSKWEEDGKTLTTVIELVFAKACDEPHWSNVYLKLCAKMIVDISPDVKEITLVDNNSVKNVSGHELVRRYLLKICQLEYEKGWIDKLPTNEDGTPLEPEMMSDEYYKLAAAKRRGLGLIRFIGELFSLQLISYNVISRCFTQLLANTVDPSEDVLENLVQLLNTVGPLIDASGHPQMIDVMNSVFGKINTIIKNAKMSSRIKFKLMDLVDLRRKKWRGKEADAGPKTMSEIHSEVGKKRFEEERALNDRRQNSRYGNDSRSNSNRGGNSNQNLASQWGSSNRVSQNDINSVGAIRSSDRFGPMNNFKSKSFKGNHQDTNNQNSNSANNSRSSSLSNFRNQQNASPSSQNQTNLNSSQTNLSAREGSKREAGNMFAALEDHDDESNESQSEEEDNSTVTQEKSTLETELNSEIDINKD